MKTIIVINRHKIYQNRQRFVLRGENPEPAISVRRGRHGKSRYPGFNIYIGTACKVIYDPYNPLPCGATCWIETDDDVLARYPNAND